MIMDVKVHVKPVPIRILSGLLSQSPGRVLQTPGEISDEEYVAPVKFTSSKKTTDNSASADWRATNPMMSH